MELWRQCAKWLIECRVLPETHRVTWEGAQVCDLAQALRDGVLLCQLLNNLLPQAVNLREINLRPQMSQFLCLKNIRTFLVVCQDKFQLKKNELFEAFDLFDVRDFAKVLNTLSILSHSPIAAQRAFQPFPLGGDISDDDIYNGLSDKIDDTVDEADDLYDCVDEEGAEGDEIYEDLMRTVEPETCGVDKRECCLQEIKQTEGKYSATLESILQHFKKPLGKFLEAQDMESIFVNIQDLASVHREFLDEIQSSVGNGAKNFHHVFVNYKQRLLLYGRYCSQVETATKHLDKLASTREDVRMKLEECSKRANSGRFSLRDLLMVPMQRVLKYPLLLQELVKHTTDPSDKENLRTALDAMRDLAQCVNEVKRDNEILRQITSFQLSIENMSQSLALFGRPKMDGELKISSTEKKSKQERYAFLFDKALFVCKKKSSETFELKEIIELQHYQVRDETAGGKDKRKWSYLFLLLDSYGKCGYDLYFKTRELKKKWLEQFAMAQSNLCPENAAANNHDFQMHNFEETACCKACSMMLRGIFFQGYRCTRCKIAAHKECLGILPTCGRSSDHPGTARKNRTQRSSGNTGIGFPMVEACQEYFGLPPPPASFGHPLYLSKGDVVELTRVEVDLSWWEGRNLTGGQVGWFPCSRVIPFSRRPTPDLSAFSWFAGNMDRPAAKNLLMSRSEGTYLVRQKDGGEFAISIKFSMDIKHIKITSYDGLFRINEKKAFKGLVEMIEFYQQNSLKECVKDVDTTLHMPYKQAEQSNDHRPRAVPKGGGSRTFGMARARYNFSARDRSELSLREGDTIRILSRKGHSGWWKGEVYGKVGFFPSNYVEEDYSDYS
ncbi:proto-oncogene vav-like isoform X2 [Phyllopteryx taeniolatus]|uniref:proto-oncogene vav-like isoform X2 n=1 Tax=Phyllopteryx taeniolatus TaxID=161469 RepID=UPI002AD28159|nr:proto-oncogene vav-like isoform X2 [Phyllopteryx taeniolatus]